MFLNKKLNIQTQFFVTYLCISIIIVSLFSSFFYKYISDILIQHEISAFDTVATSLMAQTDNALKTMDKVSINIGYSNLVKDNLNKYFNFSEPSHDDFSTLVALFVAINGSDHQVFHINLYDNSGQVIRFGTTATKDQVNLDSLEWVTEAEALNGHKLFSVPYSTNAMSNTSTISPHFISLYRAYYNKYKHQAGYIETIQKCKNIFSPIISYTQKSKDAMNVYVFNPDGALIFPYALSPDEDLSLYDHYYAITQNDNKLHSFTNPQTDKMELITYQVSSYSDWIYVCVQNEETILAPVKNFTNVLLAVVCIVFVFIVSVSYFMSKSLTRPIHQLLRTINKTKIHTLGDIHKPVLRTSFNEFDVLNEAFHSMSAELKISMHELIETREQELKSRSLALQSQMNPHFYYNSLASIMVLAENNQSEDVVTLCKSLSHIMRYITKGGSTEVSMEEEITYVEKYLYCMKVRYQSSLIYSINIPPKLMAMTIPKLLIQPLVENALKYGTNCLPLWEIKVEGIITDTYWSVSVTDSGPGFSDEALSRITKLIKHVNSQIGMPEIEINGMGLINVYSRWKLYCKKDFLFAYHNNEGGGCTVSIGRYF